MVHYTTLVILSSLNVVLIIFMEMTFGYLFLLLPQHFSKKLLFFKMLLLNSVVEFLNISKIKLSTHA
jgi:hypothetical protein